MFLDELVTPWKQGYDALPRKPEGGFGLDNPWFSSVDAEVLYGVIRSLRPRHILEIGGGWSTLLIRRGLSDGAIPCDHMTVDPSPRIPLGGYVMRKPLSEIDPLIFGALGEGDILFLDGSHRFRPGSDVEIVIDNLPTLVPGVYVHFHDIFLPDPYPVGWEDRLLDEQYHLDAFLRSHEDWEVLFSSHRHHIDHPDILRRAFASYDGSGCGPGSFWFIRRRPS